MDTFNNDVRRVANLLAYEQPTDNIDPMIVTAARLYNLWAPFPMPDEPVRFGMEASGEFTAR